MVSMSPGLRMPRARRASSELVPRRHHVSQQLVGFDTNRFLRDPAGAIGQDMFRELVLQFALRIFVQPQRVCRR